MILIMMMINHIDVTTTYTLSLGEWYRCRAISLDRCVFFGMLYV